jgi:hypothetical protein
MNSNEEEIDVTTYERVPTDQIEVGDRIEPIGYGLGFRTVLDIEEETSFVRVFVLDGEPFEKTSGFSNSLRLRRLGQVVNRECEGSL